MKRPTDIVCHRKGLHLYTLKDGTQTFLSTRERVHTPLKAIKKDDLFERATTKETWNEEDVVTVCVLADYKKHGRRNGWIEKKRGHAMRRKIDITEK